jgi:hypothetical protein
MRSPRQEALQRGDKTYFGKVCAKHPELKGERRINGHCVGCHREYQRLPKYRARARERRHFSKARDGERC